MRNHVEEQLELVVRGARPIRQIDPVLALARVASRVCRAVAPETLCVIPRRKALHDQGDAVSRHRKAKVSPLGSCLDDLEEARFDAPPFAPRDFANEFHAHR